MKISNRTGIFIVFGIGAIVSLLFFSLLHWRVPEGVPSDYYERIDQLNENRVNMYVYSDEIDFNGDYHPILVSNVGQLPHFTDGRMNILVLDMNKNRDDAFATEEQLTQLYAVYSYIVIIVNYASSNSTQFDDFIDVTHLESDMIVYYYDQYHGEQNGSVSEAFPSDQMLMYAILHQVSMILTENGN